MTDLIIKPITPEDFENGIRDLGMSVTDFAKMMGMHRRTVQRQFVGETGKLSSVGSVLWALAFVALKQGYRVQRAGAA